MILYAIFDKTADNYFDGTIVTFPAEPVAIRSFSNALKTGKGLPPIMIDNPSDFSLWQVAVFDEKTGVVTADKKKVLEFNFLLNGTETSL